MFQKNNTILIKAIDTSCTSTTLSSSTITSTVHLWFTCSLVLNATYICERPAQLRAAGLMMGDLSNTRLKIS